MKSAAILLIFVLLASVASGNSEPAIKDTASMTAEQALIKLLEGNGRFVAGNVTHPNQSAERRAEVVSAQHPFAVVVSCSDSRVPPEIIFDQGIGDVFVIRTAGEVMDNATLGTIEYGVEHVNCSLIVVLGHDSCGAVKAAVAGGEAPGHINYLVEAIKPSVDKAKGMSGDILNNSIDVNTRDIVAQLGSTKPILSEAVKEGKLKIVGARYHLDTGRVE
ncbi:MAG: carbonic anhydrase, partial [Methanotrichaceae archaeon]|nr:carbonic anhydrase [Methanotrichaceae archaeon]